MKFRVTALISILRISPGEVEVPPQAQQKLNNNKTPCEDLQPPTIEGATILSITSSIGQTDKITTYCEAKVYLRHDGADDTVRIYTLLPLDTWNTRFRGSGGLGYGTGFNEGERQVAVDRGFAVSTTDAGLEGRTAAEWARDAVLLENFAHRSVHEMTLVGKELTRQFYGEEPRKSYFVGCSAGGRQGYMEAQRYPEDYDGIFTMGASLHWDRLRMAMVWPYAVQNTRGFVPMCVFDSLTRAAIEHCDEYDDGIDGIIGNPPACDFNASSKVGETASECLEDTTITTSQADIFTTIARGPVDLNGTHLWYGLTPGTPYNLLAKEEPHILGQTWIQNFVVKEPDWDMRQLTEARFMELMKQSRDEYGDLLGTDNPDLAAFRDAGGKLLSWHGWADASIFPDGSVDYWQRVERDMGGAVNVDPFYRLFMVPGVGHCGGGNGAWPAEEDVVDLLMQWIEEDRAPETLPAVAGDGHTRDICLFPREMRYKGVGDMQYADSWECKLS